MDDNQTDRIVAWIKSLPIEERDAACDDAIALARQAVIEARDAARRALQHDPIALAALEKLEVAYERQRANAEARIRRLTLEAEANGLVIKAERKVH